MSQEPAKMARIVSLVHFSQEQSGGPEGPPDEKERKR
jgi:hypothetical protein